MERRKSPANKRFSRLVVERESTSTWRDDEEVSLDAGSWSSDEETSSTHSPYHPGPPTSDTHVEYLPTPKTTIVVAEPTNLAIAATASVREETARSSLPPVTEEAGGLSSPQASPGTGPAPMDLKALIDVWTDSLTEMMVHVTGDQAMSGMDHCGLLITPPTMPAQPGSPERTLEGIPMTETPTCTQAEKPPSTPTEMPACSPAEKPPSTLTEMSSTLAEISACPQPEKPPSTLAETPACSPAEKPPSAMTEMSSTLTEMSSTLTEMSTCPRPEKPSSTLAETPACSRAGKRPSTLSETPACLHPVVAPDVERAMLETTVDKRGLPEWVGPIPEVFYRRPKRITLPMKREGSSIYDHLQSDPRFAFRGAPSSYLSGQMAALCRNVRAQVSGVPPETTYWATGVAAIRKEERIE